MMKRLSWLALAACILVSFSAQAGGDAPATHGLLKKGFYFETDDGDYSLAITPKIQLRYAYSNREGAGNDAHSIMARRLYLGFGGHFLTPDLTYQVTLNGTFGGTPTNLLYYNWLNYRVTDAFQVKAGLHKIAFNREEMTSSGKQQFVDRSLANERYNMDRSLGVVFWGTPFEKKMEYYVSVTNGRATAVGVNGNQELGYFGRLVYNPVGEYGYAEGDVEWHEDPAVTIGVAGGYHQEEPAVSALEDDVITGNADVGFKFRGWSAQLEGFYRSTNPSGAAPAVTDMGYYFAAGYFVIPEKFEIAARVSSLFDDTGNNGGGVYYNNGSLTNLGGVNDGVDEAGDSDNEHEYSLGLNYYIKGYNLKVQAQYTYMLDGQAGANDLVNHIGMLQTEMQF